MKKIIILFLLVFYSISYDVSAKSIYNYSGYNPNNYIFFNNELWRIISKNDEIIKIIKNDSIGKYNFDENNNLWKKSSLKKYLNNNYYKSIDRKYRRLIKYSKFYTNEFNNEFWYGNVGLISIEDYDRAYSDNSCENLEYAKDNLDDITNCVKNNYLNSILNTDVGSFTISSEGKYLSYVIEYTYLDRYAPFIKRDVFPVLYVRTKGKISGNGTIENPFRIDFR